MGKALGEIILGLYGRCTYLMPSLIAQPALMNSGRLRFCTLPAALQWLIDSTNLCRTTPRTAANFKVSPKLCSSL